MREIKFRAWDGDNSEMIGPEYDGDEYILTVEYGRTVLLELHLEGELQNPVYRPANAEIMQYIGLKDSNGVEICEGDIVEFTYWWFDGNAAESQLTGEIVYLTDCMSFGLKGVKNKEWLAHIGGSDSDTAAFATWLFEGADFSVLGNIHESPELLPQ